MFQEFLLLFLLALTTTVTGKNQNLPIVALFPSNCCYLAAIVLSLTSLPNLSLLSCHQSHFKCSFVLLLVAQRVKHLSATRETWVQSLGQEDTLEKETPTHSSILAWRGPWTEKPGGLQSMGSQRNGHD